MEKIEENIVRLNSFSKILLATGTINYLANCIESVNEQIKTIPDSVGTFKAGIESRSQLLDDTVKSLNAIMQVLGDYMNDTDCISPIDMRATREAYEIINGNDDVEE